jgi:DNA-3-methyladenine glycosylase I
MQIPTRKSTPKSIVQRCSWATTDLLIGYHDREWGVPVHEDRVLFEFLILEGMQAGLSWETVLKKRENYRAAFDNFDVAQVANYSKRNINSLLANKGLIRNRLKIEAAVTNARCFLKTQEQFGSFDAYVWTFVGGSTKQNRWKIPREVPASTSQSDMLSKDLQRRGFKFVGTTICYAFMQAVGMVNDHLVGCFRYRAKT